MEQDRSESCATDIEEILEVENQPLRCVSQVLFDHVVKVFQVCSVNASLDMYRKNAFLVFSVHAELLVHDTPTWCQRPERGYEMVQSCRLELVNRVIPVAEAQMLHTRNFFKDLFAALALNAIRRFLFLIGDCELLVRQLDDSLVCARIHKIACVSLAHRGGQLHILDPVTAKTNSS